MKAPLECEAHRGQVTSIVGADGQPRTVVASVQAPPVPTIPEGASPQLQTFFLAISVLLVSTVASAAEAMTRAWNAFMTFLRFFNVRRDQVTSWVVMAFLLARCNPPVGVQLPTFMQRRVLPRTAAHDLTLLRRRARLMKDRDLLEALIDEDVLRLGSVLGTSIRKTKSSKAPILIHHLRDRWAQRPASPTLGFLRNMSLLVLGVVAGLRRRELAALRRSDAVWDQRQDELTVAVRRDKTNQVITDAQEPRVIAVAHALLTEVLTTYFTRIGAQPTTAPLFPVIAGTRPTDRSLEPSTINTIVREVLPGLPVSPHSLRVGFATELHAAGVPLQVILELGRWSSLAGLLYVLPSADQMTAATRSMGSGAVSFDRVLIQRALNAGNTPPRARVVSRQ